MRPPREESFIVEFITIGNGVKVSAIDPESGREVSLIGAAGAGREELASLAVRKLKYVLNKKES